MKKGMKKEEIKSAMAALELDRNKVYIIFVDPTVIDFKQLIKISEGDLLKGVEGCFLSIDPKPGVSVRDAIHVIDAESCEVIIDWAKREKARSEEKI